MQFLRLCVFLFTLAVSVSSVLSCGYPGAPAHSSLTFSAPELKPGVVASYACERGFELLGPARRICQADGRWLPEGIPFCVLNVAAGKAPMQSSVAGNGVPQKAVDGSASDFYNPATCTLTQPERAPWWYVNLLEPYMVQLVRLDFGMSCCGNGQNATIVVRAGNNRPDLGVNPICNNYTGIIEEGKPLFLPCNPPIKGAFVSVQLQSPPGHALSICEAFVYTDQALPIERCPALRDQPPGSTATYHGKCYTFYSQQALRFEEARQFCAARGGSLVDETNAALHGFLSWEMWLRHRTDPLAQYWLGLVRDLRDPRNTDNWRWINSNNVTLSFWSQPPGRGNCARFDGSKGWLWSDANCNEPLNFICQHRPTGCGRPEQPPNSTLIATSLDVGARIEHKCDEGHLHVGPTTRTCMPDGFYSEFPPVCRYLECGPPAQVPNGRYTLLNETRSYKSMVRYSCDEGYAMVGRNDLMCDLDQRWNGPPPRCEALICPDPPTIRNGDYEITERLGNSFTVLYKCNAQFRLVGEEKIVCNEGSYDKDPPECRKRAAATATASTKAPVAPVRPAASPSSRKPSTTTETPAPEQTPIYEGEDAFGGEGQNEDQYQHVDGNHYPQEHDHEHEHEEDGHDETKDRPVTTAGSSDDDDLAGDKEDKINQDTPDNDVSESNQIVKERKPGVDFPKNVEVHATESSAVARLNIGGMIALAVFGGLILLLTVVTVIVLLIRRSQVKGGKHERHRGSPDSHTITSVDSGSDAGLGRLYRRAWDSLAATGGPPTASTTITDKSRGKIPKDTLDYRSRLPSVEGLRDDGEMIVHDALPRKHHHHHHHGYHHHHQHNHDGTGSEWGRSVRSHRSRY